MTPFRFPAPGLRRRALAFAIVFSLVLTAGAAAPLKVLFLGDNGHHKPAERLRSFAPVMLSRGIQLVYTEDIAALELGNLKRYDAVLIYANIDTIEEPREQALFDYITQGGGLVALHCASYCFRNSERYVALVGGQFRRHAAITSFRTRIVAPENPLMQGFAGFETSGDEPYEHAKHNEQNRTILERREQEPYTWTRTEGRGRVFYTAWGHDDRTWTNPGFADLVERGIRFAAGQKVPESLAKGPAVTPFEYEETSRVPYYSNEPGAQPQGANPWTRMQKPLTPAQSMEHIVVPAGFELQLVASEPDIRKPIAMNWDERGRLWIIETTDYPNRVLPLGEPGNDRIVICEDTDRDGRTDRYTVFADGLNIPTSLAFSNGGVIVHQAPHTLFLKDTDGDGKADVREILITGWGRRDTHAGPSNLVYGPDNWFWGVVGYSGFNGTVGGQPHTFSQGFHRVKADGSTIEFPRNTNNNTWGIGFNEAGVAFASTANNNPSVYLPIPARHYAPAGLTASVLGGIADTSRYLPMTTRVREVDVFWGYTAAAGHAIYTARSYPKEYWNRIAFVAEPTGHLVGQFNLEARGGDFRSHNPTNLLASDDEWCAPIMAEVGPDGAVWVIDWYNYIVQHNPTPRGFENGPGNAYENDLRDKRHGRIYRVVWKDGKPSQQPNLHRASPAQLVAALRNGNLFWRRHAQRLLVERGRKDIVPALIELVRDAAVDEIGFNPGATHALWTLHGLQALDTHPDALAAATDALRHVSPAVRRAAVTVLPRTVPTVNAILAAGLLDDTDGQVRLATLLALAESPEVPAAGHALHAALAKDGLILDRWLADGAKMAATTQSRGFLAATTPEQIAAARAAQHEGTRSLLSTASLMSGGPGLPQGWTMEKEGGEIEAARADISHDGHHSLRLALRGENAAGAAATNVKVKRNHRYELSGWIKTEGLPVMAAGSRGNANGRRGGFSSFGGATLSVSQLPARGGNFRNILRGTTEWTQVRSVIATENLDEITVLASASLGSAPNGTTQGSVWFDDIVLKELGPADESVADPLLAVVNHVTAGHDAPTPVETLDAAALNAVVLTLGTVPDVMKFDKTELAVKAGQPVRLTFNNTDHMPHNVLFLSPGTLDTVGALADQMLNDPRAATRHYVPDSSHVLFHTPLVNPGERYELAFRAPTTPGRYPYVCTFPGHWRLMQGTLVVTP